jgi:hypothetical protein
MYLMQSDFARYLGIDKGKNKPLINIPNYRETGRWGVHLGNVGSPRGNPGPGGNVILAQLSDPHIVAAGKLFRCPIQGTSPDADRARLEFDTAPYLARAVASLNALVPRPDVTLVTGDLVDHGEPVKEGRRPRAR